jgi:1-deoxy-D-xylulose-5-phosphate reductoisomerase
MQTLEVVASQADRFEIVALGAGSSIKELAAQAHIVRPKVVGIADESQVAELAELLPAGVAIEAGPQALAALAVEAEIVVNGVVGFAGLPVTMATLSAGRRLALANKESLIAAGPVVQQVRTTPGAELIPVDSEHCALHMCLRAGEGTARLSTLVLTASGGPFRGMGSQELANVTVEEALKHPTWSMGPKITIDSSTLLNKGLEVIEAHELFGVDYDQIDVVVHPQSIVHSMAEFSDGATIAQLSMPDMRLPIGYALAYPDRIDTAFGSMDWSTVGSLTFEPPDREKFRCLDLAYAAGRSAKTAPAWLSAANEIAVEAFLSRRIGWASIADLIEAAMQLWPGNPADSLEAVLDADAAGRRVAHEQLNSGRFDLEPFATGGTR